MKTRVDVVIRDVDPGALVDTLIAIERARAQGVYDDEQIERLTPIVLGMRECQIAKKGSA